MDLIIGGAYQGKLRYAMERFHLAPEELAYYDHSAARVMLASGPKVSLSVPLTMLFSLAHFTASA